MRQTPPAVPAFVRIPITLLALALLAPMAARNARGATSESDLKQIKHIERVLLMQEANERFAEAAERAAHPEERVSLKTRMELERRTELQRLRARQTRPRPAASRLIGLEGTTAAPIPDVLVNDHTGDDASSSQNEPAIAAWGTQVVAAWNDWPNISFSGSIQGYGYSNDGGLTFTDGGDVPAPANAYWVSDPVVTVNEKTGDFYYCAMLEQTVNDTIESNGIGVVHGRFSGGALVWDPPSVARVEPDIDHFLDKPWMVADSTNGYLYLTYSDFYDDTDIIGFQRSTDGGVSWGPVITLSSEAGAGLVQGSRPCLGPNGEVYTVWKEIGPSEADYMRLRVSLTHGATFGPEQTVASIYDDFGSGAPGFNRERGIAFPGIAVDRTHGSQRGRIYVIWNESLNWIDDAPGLGSTRTEVEDNASFAHANPFTIGETLTGSFRNTSDLDTYSFSAVQGVNYVFWCDSAPLSLYAMRVFCADSVTRLAFTGHLAPPLDPQGNQRIMVWTAPASGTYYLTMDFVNSTSSLLGTYRIRTGVATRGSERGRDQRDVFVTSSTDGGEIWGTPVRINQDPPYLDDWLPEVAVGGDESVYAIWFDWRDTPAENCGGMSKTYAARSDNQGASWVQLGPISTALSDWSTVSSNLIPNEGDYNALYANENAVYAAWTDGRFGNPDIHTAPIPLIPDTLRVAGLATVEPGRITLTWQFKVGRVVNATVYRSTGGAPEALGPVTSDAAGTVTFVDESITSGVEYTYSLGVMAEGSEVMIGQLTIAAPSGRFQARPNPIAGSARFYYDVAAPGEHVHLAVYDLTGRKIRDLVNGFQPGGTHSVNWDTRDNDGRDLSSGIYFIQLSHGGKNVTTRVAIVR